MNKLTQAWGALKLTLKENSPTILVVTGVAVMGASVIVASKKTLELQETLKPHVEALEEINATTGKYTDTPENRQIVLAHTTRDMVNLYFIPGVLFVSGAGLVFWGHNIMVRRNATLAVAFTALKKSFDNYRARVVETQGHTADQYYMHGAGAPNTHGDGVLYSARDWEDSGNDPYNRVFSQQTSDEWENDLGANKFFISCKQKEAQRLLNRQGYLYLSEVYKSLGLEESDISRVVGWRIQCLGDGSRDIPVVDFGLDKPLPDDWKFNQRREIYLDFNCQGLIVGGKVQKMLESA